MGEMINKIRPPYDENYIKRWRENGK